MSLFQMDTFIPSLTTVLRSSVCKVRELAALVLAHHLTPTEREEFSDVLLLSANSLHGGLIMVLNARCKYPTGL